MDKLVAFSLDDRMIVLPTGTDMKLRIIHGVDNPLDKMTIEMICENCRISRSTFYHHFNSKYDMQPWFITTAMKSTIDHVGHSKTWAQGFSEFLRYLALESDFNQFAAQEWTPHSALNEHRQKTIIKTLEEHRGIVMDETMKALINQYVDSEGQLCVKWFRGQLKLDFEELLYLFNSCVPQRLRDLMENDRYSKKADVDGLGCRIILMQA